MKLWKRGGRVFPTAFSALALGSLMLTAAGSAPAHADAAIVPSMTVTTGSENTTSYADDGDKGKGKKGGTEPIVIGPPIIVPDPPKPKKGK